VIQELSPSREIRLLGPQRVRATGANRPGAREAAAARGDACESAPATLRRGVLLVNLGEPEGPDAHCVRRYLAQRLGDPEVTRLPRLLRWLSPTLGRVRAVVHAARSVGACRRAWTESGSPLLAMTRAQAAALAAKLPEGMRVFHAMRYGRPGMAEVLQHIRALGIEELVVVPMFPHYSRTATRTVVRELYRQMEKADCRIDLTVRGTWYDDAGYINAQTRLIQDCAAAHGLTPGDTVLVYVVQALPVSLSAPRDPYVEQVRRTADLVTQRLGYPVERTVLAFQSHPEPMSWLRPTTSEVLADLAHAGEQQVLMVPLGVTADCVDSLEGIQVRSRGQFERSGRRLFACAALNTFDPFIAALRNLVLHGRHALGPHGSAPSRKTTVGSLATATEEGGDTIRSLFMVGMSLAGRLGPGRGPGMAYADPAYFRAIKKPRCDVPDLLRTVCGGATVHEGLLWNTCRRSEFYGWLPSTASCAVHAETVSAVRRHLFGPNGQAEASAVNVLHGPDAWCHLLRTAAGLNSGLPGEREVLEQLHAAHRLAQRAGTGGLRMDRLLAEVVKLERRLREQTPWGQYAPDHCYASISQIARGSGLDWPALRCIVIGGSTTSCGILDTLAEQFGVPRRRLTLLHRGHGQGGHLKMLRKAIGSGRRMRVNRYDEKTVLRVLADADVVFFGLDSQEPVLDAKQIRGLRDFRVRPLAIFDFNLFGSTVGMEHLAGVRVWSAADLETAAAAYADDMCASEQFARAAGAAEAWICDRLPVRI
jgi:ferrochelatase